MKRLIPRTAIRLVDEFLNRQPRLIVVLFSILLIGSLGVIDFATGHELTIYFIYLLPVLFVTWYAGLGWGLVLTILSAFVWTYANELAGHIIRGRGMQVWNTSFRVLMFFIVTYLLSELKTSLAKEKEFSRMDALTGVLNSREFKNLAALEIQRSQRYHHPLTITYIDLNDFKLVNDTYGHNVGDTVLRAVAQTILHNVRSSDLVGRLGGDEFAILFIEADEQAASKAMAKIKNVLKVGIGIHDVLVTISAGLISYQSSTDTIDEMLIRADKMMYQDKLAIKGRAQSPN